MYKQAYSDKELHQILALQQQNLPKNLTLIEKNREGFLTVEHDFALLGKMNNICRHTIAIENNSVIGYALSMHPKFCREIKVLRPMFAEINKVIKNSENYMVMGQICIAKAHRGKGIFRMLYTKMQEFLNSDFTKIITEVDVKNSRSLNAHLAIGFQELKRYEAGGKQWSLIVLQ